MQNAELLLFVGVLANQAGIPIPVAPWLLAAGVLAGNDHLSLVVIVVGAVGAALGADLAWYGLGRWRGAEALAGLLRVLRQPPATVDRVTRVFQAHHLGFVWSARFLPELNPIAAGLAGITGVRLPRFLLHASGSALAWAGVWAGGGFLLAGTIAASRDRFGIPATGLVSLILTAVAVCVLALQWRRRRRRSGEIGARISRGTRFERWRPCQDDQFDGGGRRPADASAAPLREHLSERATAA